jgi:2-haloacid dehalogenase
MRQVLAFDVYGTLIDTHGVIEALRPMIGANAAAFSQAWRDRQLEYAFRRGLMQNYVDFATCTRQALEHTCESRGVALSAAQRQALLDRYRRLPAFDDAVPGLAALAAAGHRLFAFSNGTADAVETLLRGAGLRDHLEDVVSVDELRSYKPNPAVYAHFLRRAGCLGGDAWLVSANPFDVIGAVSAGMRGAWLRRSPRAVFDPWEVRPTLTVTGLPELGVKLDGKGDGKRDGGG